MKFEKVVLNGVDGIIRINFEGLELPDMGYDPSMYLDFNIKTYQPLHAGRNQEEWDKVFGYPTKFLNTLKDEELQQLALLYIYSNMEIRRKIESEKLVITRDMSDQDREVVMVHNQNLIHMLGSEISEQVAAVDKKISLYEKLVQWVYDGNVVVTVPPHIGELPQHFAEKTFNLDEAKILTAIAILCKILTPIVGLFLDKIISLDISNSYKDIYGVVIFRDFIDNKCSVIMDKLQSYVCDEVNKALKNDESKRLSNLWSGKSRSIYEDIAFSTILVRKLITVDLSNTNSTLMNYIYTCIKGACSSKSISGKNGNINVATRVPISENDDSADGNISSFEAGSFVSNTTADFGVIIENAAQHVYNVFVNKHENISLDPIRFYYLKGNLTLGNNNNAILGMLLGKHLGGAKSIEALRQTDLANLITISQIWCIENGFQDIVHLLSILPTGQHKQMPTGAENVNLQQWNKNPAYINCSNEFQYEFDNSSRKLRWDTFLEYLVNDLATKIYTYNTAPDIWDMLGEVPANGTYYKSPATLSVSICNLVLYLCRGGKDAQVI